MPYKFYTHCSRIATAQTNDQQFRMPKVIDVGVPTLEYLNSGRFIFVFHRFESPPCKKGDFNYSDEFQCFGHDWMLRLYSGGDEWDDEGKISLRLGHLSEGYIGVDIELSLIDSKGRRAHTLATKDTTFVRDFSVFSDFFDRETILDPKFKILDNGALTIELKMTSSDPRMKSFKHFVPNKSYAAVAELYDDDETCDISFLLKNGVTMRAHRCILKAGAPALFELCKDYEEQISVPLTDIGQDIFDHMLGYIYGIDVPIDAMRNISTSKAILDLAHKYGITDLKIKAEAFYTMYFDVTMDNVASVLLDASAKNYALLKETAMHFVGENLDKVLASGLIENITTMITNDTSLLSELFSLIAMQKYGSNGAANIDEAIKYKTMSVDNLRAELYDRDLDIDGSREMLIARLELDDKSDGDEDDDSEEEVTEEATG